MSENETLDAIVEMLASIVDMRLGVTTGGGHKIALLSRQLAKHAGLSDQQQSHVYRAALLHNMGLIGLPDQILKSPYAELGSEEQTLFNQSPLKAEAILMTIPGLRDVGYCIRHLYEHFDGTGYPTQLRAEEIPIEARVMVIAVDFFELQNGIYFNQHASRRDAIDHINSQRGTHYDPVLVDLFNEIIDEAAPEETPEGQIILTSGQVTPGMILSRDLKLEGGMLLLAHGRPLTEHVITGVRNLEKSLGKHFDFYIQAS